MSVGRSGIMDPRTLVSPTFSVSPSLLPSLLPRKRRPFPRKVAPRARNSRLFLRNREESSPFFSILLPLIPPYSQLHEPAGPFRSFIFLFSRNQRFPSLSSSSFRFLLFSPSLPLPSSSVARVSKIPGFSSDLFPLFCQSAQPAIARKAKGRKVLRGDVFFNASSSSFLLSVPLPVSLFFRPRLVEIGSTSQDSSSRKTRLFFDLLSPFVGEKKKSQLSLSTSSFLFFPRK